MDINIFKTAFFIVLVSAYLVIRKFFKKVADFTENIGKSADHEDELKELNTKIAVLEQWINNKP
ncbi:hypothetical protein SD427_17025 [Chryseobacterium sp. JJR-5R]|uniref:hypothetical protein n=1 Tax=Chryseobacterium sp. JJR-5R TaxID=3093923 RepID=UPI002A74EB00|nr:hypothetical protein [Chryseobacterium sp. JJR-5R]WPO82446.1 hypothetical protein SD427_17025 [Chryseobacterium sp. JJR-5R]